MANDTKPAPVDDGFFDDEQELIAEEQTEAQTAPTRDEADRPAAPQQASSGKGMDAPPFWMVVAIALIALLLGVVIGYLLGSSTALSAAEAAVQSSDAATASADTGTVATDELPEGHVPVVVDEDGTAHVAEEDTAESDASADSGSSGDSADSAQ